MEFVIFLLRSPTQVIQASHAIENRFIFILFGKLNVFLFMLKKNQKSRLRVNVLYAGVAYGKH